MRSILATALLVAMAWPAGAFDTTAREEAADLLNSVRADRVAMNALPGREARSASRLLAKSERTLVKLVNRFEGDTFDAAKFALFAKSGRFIDRAVATGALAGDAPSVLMWNHWFQDALVETDALVDDALVERDRVVLPHLREKVAGRLNAALADLTRAAAEDRPTAHARAAARALRLVEKTVAKARRLCLREAKAHCPGGLAIDADVLTNKARNALTITDVSWDLNVSTREGEFLNHVAGRLSAPHLSHLEPLPIKLLRRESVSGLALSGLSQTYGRRIDGLLVFTTSAGTINVPLHLVR